MAGGYSWNDARGGATYRLPGPEHLGWWATAALICSILIHVAIFFFLDHLKIGIQKITESTELATAPINLEQIELPPDIPAPPPPEVTPPPQANDTKPLLEEIDILKMLPKDEEIDIKPDVLAAEFALTIADPIKEGQPEAVAAEPSHPFDVETDLPELGRMEESLPPAAEGQIIVDPGAIKVDDSNLRKFTDDLLKKGAEGRAREGSLDGMASLDTLLGLPANVLVGKKTMLPSDLLFEFNSDKLRESAKIGLMKLGLLIDRNPNLFCWIEGHTDLIGTEAANLDLSRRRAKAVKDYLVDSLRMDGEKVITRGFGKAQPIIPGGTAKQQAPNRRVEIRMRKDAPPPESEIPTEPVREAAPRTEPPPPPRAEPVEEEPPPPRATEVQEEPEPPAIPRAEPVEPDEAPPEPPIPRAEPVGDDE